MFCARRGSSQCGCLRRVGQVNTPWRTHYRTPYAESMKQNNFSENQKPATASPQVSRGIDKWLWFVEAHSQAAK